MKYFLTTLLIATAIACSAQDRIISVNELPEAAQSLIKSHFNSSKPTLVQRDKDGLKVNYDVVMDNGIKLEFDNKGNWTEIDCKPKAVPSALVPTAIQNYISKHFNGTKVVQIERTGKGYEVDLSNGIDIEFNKKMKAVKIDD